MNIAVLTSLYPGPTRPHEGIFAERRWLGMVERGHEVRVVHPLPRTPGFLATGKWAEIRDLPEREAREGIEVRRPRYWHVPRAARGNADRFAQTGVRTILADGKPQVVVADYAWPAAVAAHELSRRSIPCVVNGRGSDVLEVAGEAGLGEELASALFTAGHWCAVSQDLVDTMDRLAGGKSRGHLVPNGVDLERFVPADRGEARRALGLPDTGPLVLVVGHLIERKDPHLALAAFALAGSRDARLVFLGRGPLSESVAAEVQSRGMEGRVSLRGEVPPEDLAKWYAACDVLLLTSRREGRPNVVLEALASGRPAVATAAGGTAECLGELRDELLITSRTADAVALHLGRVLGNPPSPERCRQAVAHLSWAASLDALESCLEEALAKDS